MMTGAILGGSSVQQAAKLQMVIMFMISACTALASIFTTILVIVVVVDGEHRVRSDRIDGRRHSVWRTKDWAFEKVVSWIKKGIEWVRGNVHRGVMLEGEWEERLLS